jgi:LysM repeat protein
VYVVKNGDTLWGIASKNNPQRKDIREVVYAIEQHNGITPLVHVGQSIEIPVD